MSLTGIFLLLRSLYLLRLGFDPSFLGTYYATGALTFMAMGMPSGALGQRWGARRSMIAGGYLTVGGMALLPVTGLMPPRLRPIWPLVSQVTLTIGWSMLNVNIVPALRATVTDRQRDTAYALAGSLRGAGTFLGTLLGGLLPIIIAALSGYTANDAAPYGWSLLIGASTGLAAVLVLHELKYDAPSGYISTAHRDSTPFPLLTITPIAFYVYLRHASWTVCQAYANPYLDAELHLSTAMIGALTSVGQAMAIPASLLIPRLTARRRHGWVLVGVTAAQAVSLALLATAAHWLPAGLGLVGIQITTAIWLPTIQIFQMDLVKTPWRTVAYGITTTAMGLGFGSMSFFGGHLILSRGYQALFWLGAALAVTACLLMALIAAGVLSGRANSSDKHTQRCHETTG